MLSSRHFLIASAMLLGLPTARTQTAAAIDWANTSTDFTNTLSWTGGTLINDTTSTIARFGTATILQPTVGSAFSVAGIRFATGAGAYTLSGTGPLTIGSMGIENQTGTGAQVISVPLVFSTAASLINQGTLTLSGTITNNTGLTLTGNGPAGTISGAIGGTGGLTMSGTGTWTLSGANTYSGNTTLSSGTLAIGSDNNLGAVPATPTAGALNFNGGLLETTNSLTLAANRGINLAASGGSVQTDGATTLTYGGVIAGSGQFTKSGTGTLLLSGANTYSGGTTISAGTFKDGAVNAFSPNSKVSLGAGATLSVNNNETIAGLMDLSGAGGNVTLVSGAKLTLNNNGTFSGVISGAGGLALAGTSPFGQVLTGANTYSGGTTIGGNTTLQIGLGAAGVGGTTGSIPSTNIVDNGALNFFRSDAITYGGISGSGFVQQTGSGTLTLTGTNTYTGSTEIRAGTIADAAAGSLSSSSRVVMYGGALNVGFNETIGGLGDLTISSATSPGAVTIASGATLTIGGGSTFSGTIGGAGSLVIANTAFQTLTGNATHTGGTTINSGGSLQIGNGTTIGAVSGNIVDNGFLQFKHSDAITYSGISGTGGVQQSGTGTLTFGGTNSYSGDTSINSGTISDAVAGAFSPNSAFILQAAGTALNVNFSETVAGLGGLTASAGSTVTIASGATLTVKGTNKSYSGSIVGSGDLVITGSGSQTLSGASTYTGTTTIKSGTLRLGTTNALPTTTALTLNPTSGSSALFDLAGMAQTIGSLTLSGAANNSFSTITLSGGTLTLGGNVIYDATNNPGGAKISGGSLTWTGTRTFTIGDSTTTPVDVVIDANITSGGTLTKAGTGTLALSGGNTLTGGIVVNSGTLRLADLSTGTSSGSSSGTGSLTLNAGTTLSSLSSSLTIRNAVSLGNNVTLGDANLDTDYTIAGAVTAQNALTTLHLGHDNTILLSGSLTGPAGTALTLDSGGRLILGGATSGNIGSITANGAAVIFVSSGSVPGAVTLQATNGGYIGVGATDPALVPSQASVATVMNRITDKTNFAGTFGFDTDSDGLSQPHVFNDNIDFSGFTNANFTIGSSSSAVLAGLIKPPSTGYRFGNGGGVLFVQSNLTVPTSVTVTSTSTDRALVAILRGNNTFTGNLSISNSGVVLDSANALPAGRTVTMSGASYFGATEAFKSAANFISFAASNLASYNGSSVLGFDSRAYGFSSFAKIAGASRPVRVITDTLDLSGFSSIYLGTATSINITGSIVAPGRGTLSLIGVGDGSLTIGSSLTSANVSSVVVGSSAFVGNGAVQLNGANTYAGGTSLQSGTLVVGNDSALGTGTLTVNAGTSSDTPQLASNTASGINVANPISLTTSLKLGREYEDNHGGYAAFLSEMANKLTLSGAISGAGGLNVANGRTILTGANSYAGTTYSWGGALIFGAASAIPSASTLKIDFGGYIGLGFDTTAGGFNVQTGFLDHFDKKTAFGTVGFDSPNGTQLTYADAINLADPDGAGAQIAFNPGVRLGSATTAKLTGTITPSSSSAYQFGGGGGLLDVASALVDGAASRSVIVNSTGLPPLTLRLSNTGNTFTGSTIVNDSAVVFAPSAIPAGATVFVVNSGGYIGTEDTSSVNVTAFLNRFVTSLASGTIGFDTATPTSPYTIGSNLDLTRFTASSPDFSIGSTTSLVFGSGASITLPSHASAYRFAPYKNGAIEIDFALTDRSSGTVSTGLVLGSADAPMGANARVVLAGANTYTGATTIYRGTNVVLANAQAFGSTSGIVIQPSSIETNGRPTLTTNINGLSVPNSVNLLSDLEITGSTNLTLAGQISGAVRSGGDYAQLHKTGTGTLTLSGHNTFGGGVYIHDGGVVFAQSDSIGTGPLQFGLIGTTNPTATFQVSSTVNGIYGDSSLDRVVLTAGSTLTINQTFDSLFPGTITSSGASVVYQGTGTTSNPVRLQVSGANAYNGSTTIGSGITVIAGNNNAFGSSSLSANTVVLNGGKLAVEAGVTISNPITLTSGKLGGVGTFQALPAAGAFNIRTGTILAPGLGGPGTLTFDGSLLSTSVLLLSSGGAYHWQLMDATNSSGGWDTIAVNGGVNIAANSAAPFNFKLISVASDGSSGWSGNFNPAQAYSWTVLTATSITGFTGSNQFAVDTSGFLNPNSGVFTLGLNTAGTSLMLNFNPVPEPSTYVLMIAGLGLTFFASRRRKR